MVWISRSTTAQIIFVTCSLSALHFAFSFCLRAFALLILLLRKSPGCPDGSFPSFLLVYNSSSLCRNLAGLLHVEQQLGPPVCYLTYLTFLSQCSSIIYIYIWLLLFIHRCCRRALVLFTILEPELIFST